VSTDLLQTTFDDDCQRLEELQLSRWPEVMEVLKAHAPGLSAFYEALEIAERMAMRVRPEPAVDRATVAIDMIRSREEQRAIDEPIIMVCNKCKDQMAVRSCCKETIATGTCTHCRNGVTPRVDPADLVRRAAQPDAIVSQLSEGESVVVDTPEIKVGPDYCPVCGAVDPFWEEGDKQWVCADCGPEWNRRRFAPVVPPVPSPVVEQPEPKVSDDEKGFIRTDYTKICIVCGADNASMILTGGDRVCSSKCFDQLGAATIDLEVRASIDESIGAAPVLNGRYEPEALIQCVRSFLADPAGTTCAAIAKHLQVKNQGVVWIRRWVQYHAEQLRPKNAITQREYLQKLLLHRQGIPVGGKK
jgi:hypothetical protein